MKTEHERTNPLDMAAIDRLVDGDLPDADRRELLLQLESEPDGWRRCALAFLEDQALRQALSGASAAREPSKPLVAKSSAPAGPRRSASWVRQIPIAASLLALTFAAGFATRGLTGSDSRPEIARSPEQKTSNPTPEPPPRPMEPIREVGTIDLVDGSSGETPVHRIPIYSGPGLDDQWLRNQPSSVPDYVRSRWERQGYQVKESRRVVSMVLEDGRKVSIPVDEVALDYVGQNPL